MVLIILSLNSIAVLSFRCFESFNAKISFLNPGWSSYEASATICCQVFVCSCFFALPRSISDTLDGPLLTMHGDGLAQATRSKSWEQLIFRVGLSRVSYCWHQLIQGAWAFLKCPKSNRNMIIAIWAIPNHLIRQTNLLTAVSFSEEWKNMFAERNRLIECRVS